jgi:hypothetical protein
LTVTTDRLEAFAVPRDPLLAVTSGYASVAAKVL